MGTWQAAQDQDNPAGPLTGETSGQTRQYLRERSWLAQGTDTLASSCFLLSWQNQLLKGWEGRYEDSITASPVVKGWKQELLSPLS